jgi:hypothetical protein
MLWTLLTVSKRLSSATQSSWWGELLDRAIGMSKMNANAGLSGRDTMSWAPVSYALTVVETTAQDESQHEMLLGSGIMDALEYSMLHDLPASACRWPHMHLVRQLRWWVATRAGRFCVVRLCM